MSSRVSNDFARNGHEGTMMKARSTIGMCNQGYSNNIRWKPSATQNTPFTGAMGSYINPMNSKDWALRQTVRVFSPQLKKYIQTPLHLENINIKNAYIKMRQTHSTNSFNIYSITKNNTSENNYTKPYTKNAESIHNNWKERVNHKLTINYESAPFNIINHGRGQNRSITKILESNPRACYKTKGMTEFYDLVRPTAINSNKEYQEKIVKAPSCFHRVKTPYTTECEFRKSFIQFARVFKK